MEVNVELLEVLFSQVKILHLASEQIALVEDGDDYFWTLSFPKSRPNPQRRYGTHCS